MGATAGLRDREIAGLTAGDEHLDQASVDLHVTAMTAGFGRAPFELRLLANGQVLDTRRVVPQGDGSPIDETFTVAPDARVPTVYTVAIPADAREAVARTTRAACW